MPTHPLETDDLFIYPESFELKADAILEELSKLRTSYLYESEEMFSEEKPFDYSDGHVTVLSWDSARHLSIPDISLERMNEHFASLLGYNIYLFGVVDELIGKQFNFAHGEDQSSKGANNVSSSIYSYLRIIAYEKTKSGKHLITFVDGCGGEKRII